MSDIIIGSARSDENGKYTGGKDGDQKQKTKTGDDYSGEVSMQKMYNHAKGWLIVRPKEVTLANKIAEKDRTACNNPNIGYDQNDRGQIIQKGIDTKDPTDADCSTLVREVVKEASGKDPGNFTTLDEVEKLEATGLFEDPVEYVSQEETPVYNGDILVTKTKGHTAVVISGNPRVEAKKAVAKSLPTYFKKYTGSSVSLVDALEAVGCSDTSLSYRKKIATANSIKNYSGSSAQNSNMLKLLKQGKLIKP
jgi:hypothetical protein